MLNVALPVVSEETSSGPATDLHTMADERIVDPTMAEHSMSVKRSRDGSRDTFTSDMQPQDGVSVSTSKRHHHHHHHHRRHHHHQQQQQQRGPARPHSSSADFSGNGGQSQYSAQQQPLTSSWSISSTVSTGSVVDMRNYNFDLPSHEVYMSSEESYAGQYSHIRQTLDKSFHGFYTKERQLVQDQVISYVLRASGSMKRQPQPWILFTAGAMGSGKSHALRYFKETGVLAELESFVVIDQDEVRSLLPEWHGYVQNSSKAASMLQKESGYMCEIALAESLVASRNIVFDSSLKDTTWWRMEFQRLKREFPNYRIGILYIRADLSIAIDRAEARSARTGRAVPRETIVDSHTKAANSFAALRPLADMAAIVDTTSFQVPTIVEPALETVHKMFVQ